MGRLFLLYSLLVLLLVFSETDGEASSIPRPLSDLVRESDLIAIGTLCDVVHTERYEPSEYMRVIWTTVESKGTIYIDAVLWGPDLKTAPLKWSKGGQSQMFSEYHESRAYQKGVWLLRNNGTGEYYTHSRAFFPLNKIDEIVDAIAENPLRVCMKGPFKVNHPISAELIVRNPSFEEKLFPGMRYERNTLIHSPGVQIKLSFDSRFENQSGELFPLERVNVDTAIEPFQVPGRGEIRIPIHLSEHYSFDKQTQYRVSIEAKGWGETNGRYFFVSLQREKKIKPSFFMKRLDLYYFKPSPFHKPDLVTITYS